MNFTDALEWMRESEDNVIVSRDEDGASYMKLSGDFLRCNDTNSKGYWPIAEIGSWMLDATWRPVGEEDPPKGRLLNPIGCPPFNPSKEEPSGEPGPKQARELNAAEMDEIICAAREIEFPWDWSRHEFPWGSGTRNATRLAIMKHLGQSGGQPKEEPSEAMRYWAGRFPIKEEPKPADKMSDHEAWAIIYDMIRACGQTDAQARALLVQEPRVEPKGCEHDWSKADPSSAGALICQKCGEKWHWFDWSERATALTHWTITPSPLSAGDKPVAKGFVPEPDPIARTLRPGRHNRGGEA
jgi:hypothetical protein